MKEIRRGRSPQIARILLLFLPSLVAICILLMPAPASAAAGTNGWHWPVGDETTSPYFGFRHPSYPSHIGADFPTAHGEAVYAVSAGTVVVATYSASYAGTTEPGGCLGIMHTTSAGRSFYALYGHLRSFAPGVYDGATVTPGQLIGYTNDWANGYHLHFGIHPDSQPPVAYQIRGISTTSENYGYVDPVAFLKNNLAPGNPAVLAAGWWGPWAGAPVLACEDTSLWTKATPVGDVGSVWYEASYFGSSHGLGAVPCTDADNFRMTWWPPLNTSMKVNLRCVAYNKASVATTVDYPRYITEEQYTVAGDFDGDGDSDLARLVDAASDTDIWLFESDGSKFNIRMATRLPQTGRLYVKATAGDIDGDNCDELLLFESGSGADFGVKCGLRVLDYSAGVFTARQVWSASSGWAWERVKPACGDVDADGRDELVGFYDYDGQNGWDTGMWVWHLDGATATANREWTETHDGWYDWNSSNLFCGDFDGDGIDEPGSFYRYGDHQTGLFVWERASDGTWTNSRPWYAATGWEFGSTKPTIGDFDNDGRDEIANFYDYAGWDNKAVGLWVMDVTPTVASVCVWTTPKDSWSWVRVRPVSGDYDGDGADEISALYDYHWNAETAEAWTLFMWRPSWSWQVRGMWTKSGGAWGASTPTVSSPFAEPRSLTPVYRFYRPSTGTHFYTADAAEMARVRDTMRSTYSLDGIGYYVNTANAANAAPLYRFYNRRTGTHLYTADEGEKNSIIANLSGTYSLDGVAYKVSRSSGLQVHRFYSPSKGVHFYSADPTEIANVRANLGHIWQYEGPAYAVGQ